MTAVTDDELLRMLRRYGDHPSGFLTYNDKVEHFTDPSSTGVVAYRRRGRHVFCLGAPIAPSASRADLLAAFRAWAGQLRLQVAAVQLRHDDLALFPATRYVVNRLGQSYSIDLAQFHTSGAALAKVRQNVRRAQRDGVTVSEVPDSPTAELDRVDRSWLRTKGRHTRQLDFLVGERGGRGAPYRRLFVARCQDRVVGYVSYSPSCGSRPGWLYDLTRRTPDAPVGTIELVNLTALQTFQADGAGWLHLGLTPFVGSSERGDSVEPAGSPSLRRMLGLVERHGAALYAARNAHSFKIKWSPHVVEPEYLAFPRPLTPAAPLRLLRLVNAI